VLKRIKDYFEKTKVKIFRLEISLKSLIKLALLYLVILILPKVFHMSLKQTVIFLILFCAVYVGIIFIVSLAPFSFRWIKEHLNWLLLPFVPVAVLIVIFLFISLFHFQGNKEITRADVLAFSGDYISFVGAFCLGYFLYLKDLERDRKEKRIQIRLLLDSLEIANRSLMRIRHAVSTIPEVEDVDKKLEGKFRTIQYDQRWRLNYYAYESLMGPNHELKDSIEKFWEMVEYVNNNLQAGKVLNAAEICGEYIKETSIFAIQGYDFLEISLILSSAGNEFWIPTRKGFLYQKETIKQIENLKEKYYGVIENYIYNYMVKASLTSLENNEEIQRSTVEWLCENSEEIKEYIKFDMTRKRAVSRAVFECSVQFEKSSSRLSYCWGTYSLRM
jgi:hypothetical protein